MSTLTGWVSGGGNLVAMRPDKQLAGLLGITDANATRANAYLKVDTTVGAGCGDCWEFVAVSWDGGSVHVEWGDGGRDAVFERDDGDVESGGDVAFGWLERWPGGGVHVRSCPLGRLHAPGNPAWVGQERDGVQGIRPDDLFYGAKAGDVQPDWLDTNRIAIPQADEQQRLLLNMITTMARDKLPLPRFWYLPRGEKAVVVMSDDDHSPSGGLGGTATRFDRYKALSPAGCNLAEWECVRSTSYLFPDSALSNAQAAAYLADGFEVALHPVVASCPTSPISAAQLSGYYDTQLSAFAAKYTSVPAPTSSRTHCVFWPDWASNAEVELAHGIRMDANYYHYPGPWIGAKPGFLNGGGFPMRFAKLDGTPIDIYQQNTNMTDESRQDIAATIATLLDNALGPQGYYAALGANMHADQPTTHPGAEAIIAAAQTRDVPIISYKQLLTWTDARNNSTIRGLTWNAGTLTFITTIAPGATGLQTMLPTQGPDRHPHHHHPRRHPHPLHHPNHQRHPIRPLHHHHRHLPSHLRMTHTVE